MSASNLQPIPDDDEDLEPLPEAGPTLEEVRLDDPALYLNRELTWLAFNARVLHEADDPEPPA